MAVTSSNLNRFSKFFHHWKEKELSIKSAYYFPSHLKYVAALPVGIQKFKFVVKLPNKIKTRIIFVKNESFIHIIRDAANQFEDKFNDELLDSYMNKDFNNFWHCWRKKTCIKSPRTSGVAGLTKDTANKFADYFAAVCDSRAKTNVSFTDDSAYETLLHAHCVRESIAI